MSSIFLWLRNNKFQTFLIVVVYYALVVFPHKWVGLKINAAFSGMPRAQYDFIILVIALTLLLFLLALMYQRLKVHPEKIKLLFFFVCTIACMFLVTKFLFVVNIESVHYFQYGIAAILVFMLIENYFVSLFIAFLMGVLDEAYQYFYLLPEGTAYYDFNDVITNLLGAAFGLLILRTFRLPEKQYQNSIYMRGFLYPLIGISLFMMALLQTNILSIYPSSEKYMLVKKSGDSEDFENGLGIWNDDGSDCARLNTDGKFAKSGNWYVRLRNNSRSSSMTSSTLNLSSFDSVSISLSYITKGMGGKNSFHLEMLSEMQKEWVILHTCLYQIDFTNDQRKDIAVHSKAPLSARFRIRCDADSNSDRVFVDDVVIKGFSKMGRRFHIVKPLAGLLLIVGLFFFYFFCFGSRPARMN